METLIQNRFRDYDPSIGRHLQSDRIGLAGGINTYGYGLSNPLRFIDRMGLDPGDLFDTEMEAANDAMTYIASHHQWIDFEFAATIYQLFTGPAGCKYSYTEPRTDFSPISVSPTTDVPPGSDITADYHNHIPEPGGPILLPDGSRIQLSDQGQNQFSGGPVPYQQGDINGYEQDGVTGYMGSPNGKLNVYYPKDRKPKQCGCEDKF